MNKKCKTCLNLQFLIQILKILVFVIENVFLDLPQINMLRCLLRGGSKFPVEWLSATGLFYRFLPKLTVFVSLQDLQLTELYINLDFH